jgi:hypothetical protein
MNFKSICLIALLVQNVLCINATIAQKLILKNGSELEGYISMQRPGENFTFATERAMIFIPSPKVKSFVDHDVNIKELPASWKEWAEKNDAFVGLGDNRILVLSDIITETGIVNKVRVLERGAKIKYIEMTPNTYSLTWDTISMVKVEKRSKTALSGINRIYQLSSGMEYEGQYVEEVPGKTLSLYRDNGVVEVFNTSDVVRYSMRKINPNQNLLKQSELLDIVQLKNGTSVKGIIIEQNYKTENGENSYLLTQLEDGSTRSIKLNDIIEYRKETNLKYKPLYDILLRERELVVNRQMTKAAKITENSSGVLLEDIDTCCTVINKKQPETEIVIEARFTNEVQNRQLKIIKANKYVDKKKKVSYGFTFENIVKTNIQPVSVETSVNNTTRMQYMISGEGLFVIYDPQAKTAISFMIKSKV